MAVTREKVLVLGLILGLGMGCGRGEGPASERERGENPGSGFGERQPSVMATAATESAPTPATHAAETGLPSRELRYACASPEELVIKILAAVEADDMQGLTDLRVTEREHNQLLWPEFPARNNNVQMDFAWDMLNTRSYTSQGRAIGTWRQEGLTFAGVRFDRGVERYQTFVLHRGTVVSARTADGQDVELRFIGSILELDGQFKALSYKDYD
jgi:hypothetical protein